MGLINLHKRSLVPEKMDIFAPFESAEKAESNGPLLITCRLGIFGVGGS